MLTVSFVSYQLIGELLQGLVFVLFLRFFSVFFHALTQKVGKLTDSID